MISESCIDDEWFNKNVFRFCWLNVQMSDAQPVIMHFNIWIGTKHVVHYERSIVLYNYWKQVNTLRPRHNGRHFADVMFECIFLNENVWIPIEISMKFVPKGPTNNIQALVQIMALRRPGDKPLSEPMMDISTTHVCVTWPQWVNFRSYLESETDSISLIIDSFHRCGRPSGLSRTSREVMTTVQGVIRFWT